MKILIIIGNSNFCNKAQTNNLEKKDINSYSSVYAFYVINYLKKIKHIKLFYSSITGPSNKEFEWNNENLGKHISCVDHCISFEQRTFFNRNISYYNIIRSKVKGKITTICDNNYNIGPEDCTFFSVGYIDNRIIHKSLYVGRAAEPSECYIDKEKNKIRILIDHSYYGINKYVPDYSKEIINDVCKYVKKNTEKFHVRRFISGGVETLNINNPKFEIYNRNGLSFEDASKEYNKAHIFIVTHLESLGLSVIEASMSGALILIPNESIKPWLVEPLNYINFDPNKGIPWDLVIKNINPLKCREKALPYNYQKVTNKIINYLNS